MEFWFLKRVEKEAILNQGSKLHHSRLHRARSSDQDQQNERQISITSLRDSLENSTTDEREENDEDDRNSSDEQNGRPNARQQADFDDRQSPLISHRDMMLASWNYDYTGKQKRKVERPAFLYKEESDKSFLWGRSDASDGTSSQPPKISRGWRGVFRKYHQLERNWKEGNCAVKTLVSRRRVYCILFSEEKQLLWSGNAKGVFFS